MSALADTPACTAASCLRRYSLPRWPMLLSLLMFVSVGTASEPPRRNYMNVERLLLARLAAVHADVQKLQARRVRIPALPGLNDYRCILHAHAEDSSHTGGTLPEMLADAKKASVHAILLTDHYRPPRDFIDGRWRGLKEGVLFVPGAETHGFLIYPMKSILPRMDLKGKDFVDTVTAELMIESMQRVANRHVVIFVTQRGSVLQRAVDAAPERFEDVAQAVIAHDFLRERSIVFERLERLGVHCLDVPSRGLSVALINRYLLIKQRGLI